MNRLVVINKKGKKMLVNVPSWEEDVPVNGFLGDGAGSNLGIVLATGSAFVITDAEDPVISDAGDLVIIDL